MSQECVRATTERAAFHVNAGTPAAARSWFSSVSSCASAWPEATVIGQPLRVVPEVGMPDDGVGLAAGGVDEAAGVGLAAGGVDEAAGVGVAVATAGPRTVNVALAWSPVLPRATTARVPAGAVDDRL